MIAGAVVTRPAGSGRRSLRREQPPVGGLPAAAQLQLDAAVEHALDRAETERGVLARQDADQLGRALAVESLRELAEHRPQRLARIAPGEHLVLHEADRLAA